MNNPTNEMEMGERKLIRACRAAEAAMFEDLSIVRDDAEFELLRTTRTAAYQSVVSLPLTSDEHKRWRADLLEHITRRSMLSDDICVAFSFVSGREDSPGFVHSFQDKRKKVMAAFGGFDYMMEQGFVDSSDVVEFEMAIEGLRAQLNELGDVVGFVDLTSESDSDVDLNTDAEFDSL